MCVPLAAPWLTKLASAYLRGTLETDQGQLAKEAVNNLTRLGPTFIKLGQILSIRSAIVSLFSPLFIYTHCRFLRAGDLYACACGAKLAWMHACTHAPGACAHVRVSLSVYVCVSTCLNL